MCTTESVVVDVAHCDIPISGPSANIKLCPVHFSLSCGKCDHVRTGLQGSRWHVVSCVDTLEDHVLVCFESRSVMWVFA